MVSRLSDLGKYWEDCIYIKEIIVIASLYIHIMSSSSSMVSYILQLVKIDTQGRIYYEAKEAGASRPGAGGGPRAFFPAIFFIYIYSVQI